MDGGLGLGGLKGKKLALLSKWEGRYMEEDTLWHKVVSNIHGRSWSIAGNGLFTVKSLTNHPSPFSRSTRVAIRKTKSPRRVNILIWIMPIGSLNVSSVLQYKMPSSWLSPSICPWCHQHGEDSISSFCAFIQVAAGQIYSLFLVRLGCMVIKLKQAFSNFLLGLTSANILSFFG